MWIRRAIFRAILLLITLVLITLAPNTASGQQATEQHAVEPPAHVDEPEATLQSKEILHLLEVQQQTIEQQSRDLEALKRQIEELRMLLLAGREAIPAAPSPQADPTVTRPPEGAEDPGAEGQLFFPELPLDVVRPGDFPRSIRIPGTDAALRIGGFARATWVTSIKPQQTNDRFVTSSIPVDVIPIPVNGVVQVTVVPSRFDLDLRTPTGVGYMRGYLETDFAGSGSTLRIRHAYGQWKRFLFGQTWSTFEDPEAVPPGIDFEGLNARVDVRQPMIQWTWAAAEKLRVAFAIESPISQVTGATGIDKRPDFVSHVRWELGSGAHIQAGGVFRQIRGYPGDRTDDVVQAFGWGANVSSRFPSPLRPERDRIMFQLTGGEGIGRYVKDLQSEGGQDGVFDPAANRIRVVPASAGYVGYDHWWTDQFHSAFTVGVVNAFTLGIQAPDTLSMTRRYSGNLMWLPIPRLELVAEFLYGVRVNRDGHSASAAQTQIGSTFRF